MTFYLWYIMSTVISILIFLTGCQLQFDFTFSIVKFMSILISLLISKLQRGEDNIGYCWDG